VYPVLTAGTLLSATSNPFDGTAQFVATSPKVASGDRGRAALVEIPAVFNGSLSVRGAAYNVVARGTDREVWLYPRGGRYSLKVRP
jgi:hypothetical protein